jgi:adenylate cyclase
VRVGPYFALGLPVSAAIPLAYQVISIGWLISFVRTKRLGPFRASQLTLMLILPFLLQLSLGGFVPSNAVILWSFTAPVGALMFKATESSIRWFVAYAALLVVAGLQEPLLSPADIPTPVMVTFFVLNLAGVSMTAFLLLRFFVLEREKERAKSERLLLNVLPAPIADRLRDSHDTAQITRRPSPTWHSTWWRSSTLWITDSGPSSCASGSTLGPLSPA